MRKMLLIPLIVCMVALLPTLWMPAVYATETILVEGTWSWRTPSMPSPPGYFNVIKVTDDGNVFISADADEKFTGTFDGTAYDVFTMVIHPEGFITGRGRTLFSGTVEGRSGTLVIQWVGNTKNDLAYWWFMWVILSGTGELANLRGQGTCWGPGPAGPGVWGGVDMSGQIHFD